MDYNEQSIRLNEVKDEEWLKIVTELTKWVGMKLRFKTQYGAHSDYNLGGNPTAYYVDGAVEKLFTGEWKWKQEKYTLLEQLQVIAGSMMSENVRKASSAKIKMVPTETEELINLADREDYWEEEEEEKEEKNRLFDEALAACSEGDEELSLYVMALQASQNMDEICTLLAWDKRKVYVVQRKLHRKICNYFKQRNE